MVWDPLPHATLLYAFSEHGRDVCTLSFLQGLRTMLTSLGIVPMEMFSSCVLCAMRIRVQWMTLRNLHFRTSDVG